MNCSMPGLPVHHQFLEFAQTHVPWVGDAIQTSHPLSSTSPAFGLSQQKGLFKWVRLFALGGQSIGISASASIPPMNIQDWFPLRWTHWISLQSKGPSHHSSKASILWCSAFFMVQLLTSIHDYGKTIGLIRQTFVSKVMFLFFNMLSRLVITFLPRRKLFLISWL